MKLSISLSEQDLAVLDRYVDQVGLASRSAAIQRAIRMLADPELDEAYAAAWQEWDASGDAADWELVAGDGLSDAAR